MIFGFSVSARDMMEVEVELIDGRLFKEFGLIEAQQHMFFSPVFHFEIGNGVSAFRVVRDSVFPPVDESSSRKQSADAFMPQGLEFFDY